jgi:hypothetical protein
MKQKTREDREGKQLSLSSNRPYFPHMTENRGKHSPAGGNCTAACAIITTPSSSRLSPPPPQHPPSDPRPPSPVRRPPPRFRAVGRPIRPGPVGRTWAARSPVRFVGESAVRLPDGEVGGFALMIANGSCNFVGAV